MSYKKSLICKIEAVGREERKRRKGLKEMIELISLKVDAEMLYGKAMDRIASVGISSYPQESKVFCAMQGIKEDCRQKWASAKKYSEEVSSEVLKPLKEKLQKQIQIQKSIDAKWKYNYKLFEAKKSQVAEACLSYQRSIMEFDDAMLSYERLKEHKDFNEDKRLRQNQKIIQLLINNKESEKQYKTLVYSAKELRSEYIKALGGLLEHYQNLEEDRLDEIANILRIYFTKEQELSVSRGEAIAMKSELVKEISKELEIASIIEAHSSKNVLPDDIMFKRSVSMYPNVLSGFDRVYSKGASPFSFDIEKARLSVSAEAQDDLDEKTIALTHSITKLLTTCWDCKDLSPSDKEHFKELMNSAPSRKIFGECLNQYRKKGIFSMKEKAFSNVAEMLYITLTQAQIQDDIECAFNMMILSQTFSLDMRNSEGKSEKQFLQLGIQKHPYWQNKSLWEKAITSSIEEELGAQQIPGETPEEKNMRECNIIFGKLGTFAHNMLQFEISREEVEHVIFGFCKQRGITEPFLQLLNQTITNTALLISKTAPPQKDLFLWMKDLKSDIETKEEMTHASGSHEFDLAAAEEEKSDVSPSAP